MILVLDKERFTGTFFVRILMQHPKSAPQG